jgi:hypothetical protein
MGVGRCSICGVAEAYFNDNLEDYCVDCFCDVVNDIFYKGLYEKDLKGNYFYTEEIRDYLENFTGEFSVKEFEKIEKQNAL